MEKCKEAVITKRAELAARGGHPWTTKKPAFNAGFFFMS